jgi:hypothetical protein
MSPSFLTLDTLASKPPHPRRRHRHTQATPPYLFILPEQIYWSIFNPLSSIFFLFSFFLCLCSLM